MNRTQRMIALFQEKLTPTFLDLQDDSLKHLGHQPGMDGEQTHYTLTIESPLFTGMGKVKRHQAIYALLGDEFNAGLHALAIHAFAPGER